MRVTVKKINEAIAAVGVDAEIVKGNGYWYFDGPAMARCYRTAVYTNSLNGKNAETGREIDVEWWLSELNDMLNGN